MENLRTNPLYYYTSITTYVLLFLFVLIRLLMENEIQASMFGELCFLLFSGLYCLFYGVIIIILTIFYFIRRKSLERKQPNVIIDIGAILSLVCLSFSIYIACVILLDFIFKH